MVPNSAVVLNVATIATRGVMNFLATAGGIYAMSQWALLSEDIGEFTEAKVPSDHWLSRCLGQLDVRM